MPLSSDTSSGGEHAAQMTASIRIRTGLLVLLSSASVALAFGLSFYFALLSNQTAVARQFPELTSTVERFRSMLVMNTFSFVAIIIISFWVLSKVAAASMFAPLGSVLAGMKRVSENRLPEKAGASRCGPLSPLENQWSILLSTLREIEEREISALRACVAGIAGPGAETTRKEITAMIELKEKRLGKVMSRGGNEEVGSGSAAPDPVFMQPL